MYSASIDLVMEFRACAFSQHNKKNFLYSATIVELAMKYLPKALKDGIVDIPSNRAI